MIAGGEPLYGTWTTSIPAIDFNSSQPRWFGVPLPADAQLSCFGFAFARTINSFTFATGNSGLEKSIWGLTVPSDIGAKSVNESYEVLFSSALMMRPAAVEKISVYPSGVALAA